MKLFLLLTLYFFFFNVQAVIACNDSFVADHVKTNLKSCSDWGGTAHSPGCYFMKWVCTPSFSSMVNQTGAHLVMNFRYDRWQTEEEYCPGATSSSTSFSTVTIPVCFDDTPKKKNSNKPRSNLQCGSIVDIENGILMEEIQIVGSKQKIKYSSALQDGFKGNNEIIIPLNSSGQRADVVSFDIELKRGGVVVDTVNIPNGVGDINYSYEWNGLDITNIFPTRHETFKVIKTVNLSTSSYTTEFDIRLGSFRAIDLGLGGWLPESYYFLDLDTSTLVDSSGIRSVVKPKEVPPYWIVGQPDTADFLVFDSDGKLQSVKTGLTGMVKKQFVYEANGFLKEVQEPFNQKIQFNRSGVDLISITSPNGQTTDVSLNSQKYISQITNPKGEVYGFTYDPSLELLKTFSKPNGSVSTFYYDLDGRLIKDQHSGGYFFEIARVLNSTGNWSVKLETPMGRESVYSVDSSESESLYTSSKTPSGVVKSKRYSPDSGQFVTFDGGIQDIIEYEDDPIWGSAKKIERRIYRGAPQTDLYISKTSSLTNSLDPFSLSSSQYIWRNYQTGLMVTLNYNAALNKFSNVSGMGRTAEVEIDVHERPVQIQFGNQAPFEISYTDQHLTSIEHGSRLTSFSYNSSTGNLTSIKNALNETTSYGYDLAGRVVSQGLPDGRIVVFGRDNVGNILSITPQGRPSHTFNLNSQELVNSYTPPSLIGLPVVSTNYVYNLDKQLTQLNRPNGDSIYFNYDLITARLGFVSTPSGNYIYSWKSNIDLINRIAQPDGRYTELSYQGDIISGYSEYESSLSSSAISHYGKSITSGLVNSDYIANRTWATSNISYLYNQDEQISKAGDILLSYNTPNGYLVGSSIGIAPNKIEDSYVYNAYGEVTGYSVSHGTTPVYELNLTRDDLGRVINKNQLMNSVAKNYDYDFDSSGRLVEVQLNSALVSNYAYDSNSNRTGGVVYGTSTTGVYDDQDRLNSYNVYDFTYNANGELQTKVNTLLSTATSYIYDVFGNLKEVTLPSADIIAYEVDGLNRRIGKKLNGVLQKRWVYMDQLRIAGELDASGNISKRFVYASKQNIPDYMIYGGENYRIISDHLGSLRLVIKVSDGTIIQRMDHDEFGRVIEDTNPGFLPFGFAGGLYDHQTGLVRFGARDYDPEIGRWTSKDPILFNGGDTNLFGYVQNDPVNFIDPSGLRSLDPVRGCPDGNCGGSLRDEYLDRTQISISQAQNNDRIVRNIGLVGAAALTSPVTVPLAINACLSNPTACTTAGASFLTGVLEGATGEQTGFPPNDLQDAIFGGIGRGIGECLRGQ